MMPVVTIRATDPIASRSGDTGTFTVFRQGDTNMSLLVFYVTGGTASNGVDYAQIGPWVSIPAGVLSNTITVTPIDKGQTDAVQTVVVQLAPSPLMMPVNYVIGSPDTAVVYIEGIGVTNIPPEVRIVAPTNGALFPALANIPIVAEAIDPDGNVATVEFFENGNSLGFGNRLAGGPYPGRTGNVFSLVWSNAPSGDYALTAKATDNGGAMTLSAPIKIQVSVQPQQPVVTIRATDPYATPACGTNRVNPGQFTVYRSLGTNIDLPVSYAIGGTASNGVDYVAISNTVVIPTGAFSADILITPLPQNALATTETVVLRILPPVCPAIWPPPPECYLVGNPSLATVYISGCPPPPTNLPPCVRMAGPPNGAIFRTPVDIPLSAYARDGDGYITSVEFFAGTNSLGFGSNVSVASNPVIGTDPTIRNSTSNLYFLVWSNAPVGAYALTAKATDNDGATSISAPVNITILPPPPPPPTNRPPVVSIVASDPVAIEGTNCWGWPGMTNSPPSWSNWPVAGTACRYFTNCGPKSAAFTVRRAGSTNDPLTVAYDIGGTATNGVDYVPLTGTVTIPAGARQAIIAVVPLDDGPPDINSTVILRLTPSPTTNYVVGFPRSAAVIIIDSTGPRPVTSMLPDRCFHVGTAGPDGAWFRLDYSTDMRNWNPLCTSQVVNGAIDFVDPDASGDQVRFYRAVPEAGPPPQ